MTPVVRDRGRRRSQAARRGGWAADLIGVVPAALLYCAFIFVPMVAAVALSLFSWNGLGTPSWAGISNWQKFVDDPIAHGALLTTLKITGLSCLIQTSISMPLGLFTAGSQRYRAVYSTIYFLPLLMSTAGLSLMWQGLLDPNLGAVYWLAQRFGIGFLRQNWLGDPSLTLYVVVFIIAWQFVPFHMLLYQVGRRRIPQTLYEAASLDGASAFQTFVYITLPQLRYTIVTSITLILVGSMTYFDILYILTNGGPGNTTNALSLEMYKLAFQSTEYGYASVLAVVLGTLAITVAVVLMKVTGFGGFTSQQEGAA